MTVNFGITCIIKAHVKSILNVCSEFVTPQKNVLLTTQPNLNTKKYRQVNKIRYQNLEKISSILFSQTLGTCPLAALKPRPLAGKLPSLSTVFRDVTITWFDDKS